MNYIGSIPALKLFFSRFKGDNSFQFSTRELDGLEKGEERGLFIICLY